MTDYDIPSGDAAQSKDADVTGMRAALEWSQRGLGWTSPRPSVGCVLVKDGQVLSGAHTQPGHGNPHAEAGALNVARDAGVDVRGATAYVTLEPCSHYATTPPCSLALINAGIQRVVCGVLDPNPAVNGRGMAQMREAGLDVRQLMQEECARVHEQFLVHIVENRPFVTLKSAVSLDGKIAHRSGQSQWITGEAARRRVHEMRHLHDVVLIGIGTALADNPSLTVRLDEEEDAGERKWKQPVRLVLDAWGRLSRSSKLLQSVEKSPIVVAIDEDLPRDREQRLLDAGAQVWRFPAPEGKIELQPLLQKIYEREWCSMLIEGGSAVTGAFLEAGLADKVAFFMAPLLMGRGISVTGDYEADSLAAAPRLRGVRHETLGDDVLVTGYLNEGVTRFF